MELKIPTTLNEAIVSIAQLQRNTSLMQGQIQMLLSFVCSEPASQQKFAIFAKCIADADSTEVSPEMQYAARVLILHKALQQHLSQPNSHPLSGGISDPEPPESVHKSKVIQFPNPYAGGLLIRTVLDLAVQRLYDINDALEETKGQDGRTIGLTKRINNLLSRHRSWFESSAICNKLQRFVASDSPSFVHIETLNDYVHGAYGQPTKEDLRNFWAQFEPLIEMILEED